MKRFQVVVGNVGTVADTDDECEAIDCFAVWRDVSREGIGRAGNESVILMRDNEPLREYAPECEARE